MSKPQLYFKTDKEWYNWLKANYNKYNSIHLIFYKLETNKPTMRWEDAVKVALCFGWIDSTVRSLGEGKRKQVFTPRNPKSAWSSLNKRYIEELKKEGLLAEPGLKAIKIAKENGSWSQLDDVDNGIIPAELMDKFKKNPTAYSNYKNFAASYRKGYLYWLHNAKRQDTRTKRILEIVKLCEQNIKAR